MRVEPKTEKEIREMNLFDPGIYDFEVTEAKERESSSGNPMIELRLIMYIGEKTRYVTDYLVSTPKMAYKIRHFAEATGMLEKYEAGEIDPRDMIGRAGKCEIIISSDKEGVYADRNAVKDYIPTDEATAEKAIKKAKGKALDVVEHIDLTDDEIPF